MNAFELLSQPVTSLIGATPRAAAVLKELGITAVQDLASSSIFNLAGRIAELASPSAARSMRGAPIPPADLIDRSELTTPLEQLADRPVSILTHIGVQHARSIESELGVSSVRELARWQPYQEARSILASAYGSEAVSVFDPEAPDDLVPANGRYPTERVQYEILLFDKFLELGVGSHLIHKAPKAVSVPESPHVSVNGKWEKIKDLLGENEARPIGTDGPLDLTDFFAGDQGYDVPAIGGLLTFTQSWYGQGLALGSLIHSVALAPGESTKIAMIDWTRTTRAATSESIAESEQLFSSVARSRAISEITSSVARETQRGQSGAAAHADSSQFGGATGSSTYGFRNNDWFSSFGGFVTNLMNDTPQTTTSGSSWGSSTSNSSSTSWSTSSGEREIAAELAQSIMDRTQQASQSVRSRRASIVREVSQQESEQLTTRTVTNYNHMHALTVQYYEIVQLNRTVIELSKADRCLFVPIKPLTFADTRVIDRFKQLIALNGLKASVRALALADPGNIAFFAPRRTGNWDAADVTHLNQLMGVKVGAASDPVLILPTEEFRIEDVLFNKETPFSTLLLTYSSGEVVELPLAVQDNNNPIANLHLTQYLTCPLKDIRRAEARKSKAKKDYAGTTRVGCFYSKGQNTPNGKFYWNIDVPVDSETVLLFEAQPTIGNRELIQHLNDNRLYYSQAIWRSLDPTTIGIMLSRYTWQVGGDTRALVELVDPTPVSIVANYLVFRLSGDDEQEKQAWLERKQIKIGTHTEDLVPVPSGGVFAEAVLGRFNAAEKLDITRFWNWQDSPIPVQAPEIAPVQAGSRQSPEGLPPSSLGAPVLTIVNPPALPDPQGMAGVLAAIQNGGMFRDMSGLAATIGLAQAALAGTQQGASSAATQAGQNAAVAAQLNEKLTGALIQMLASYITGGKSLLSSGGGSSQAGIAGGISGQGSKINQAKDMDARGVGTSTNPGLTASPSTNGHETSHSAPVGPNESSAFQAAIGADGGGASGPFGELLKMAQGTAPAAPATAWPNLDRTSVMARLKQLAQDANLVDQGCIGLCPAAVFYHHIIQKSPVEFYLYAEELYHDGFSWLGKLDVTPSADLRNADYKVLQAKNSHMPPQADWMVMSALRDSENWIFDFQGSKDEDIAMSTSVSELRGWYEKIGVYSQVEYDNERSLDAVKRICKHANNHVTIWIDAKILDKKSPGGHVISLESPISIDEANDEVRFSCWTWGERTFRNCTMTISEFLDNYYGVIVASF